MIEHAVEIARQLYRREFPEAGPIEDGDIEWVEILSSAVAPGDPCHCGGTGCQWCDGTGIVVGNIYNHRLRHRLKPCRAHGGVIVAARGPGAWGSYLPVPYLEADGEGGPNYRRSTT